jgi:pentatricopeptide repeat protein
VLDSYIYTAAMEACEWPQALKLLEEMEVKGIATPAVAYSVTIKKCGNGGQWRRALDLIESMRRKTMPVNVYIYNAAIAAISKAAKQCAKSNDGNGEHWIQVVNLLAKMRRGGPEIQPNKVAYTAAISSCGRVGQVDHAMRLFRQMQEQGLAADVVAYNALFTALRIGKKSNAAFKLWDEMLGLLAKPTYSKTFVTRSMFPDVITVTE